MPRPRVRKSPEPPSRGHLLVGHTFLIAADGMRRCVADLRLVPRCVDPARPLRYFCVRVRSHDPDGEPVAFRDRRSRTIPARERPRLPPLCARTGRIHSSAPVVDRRVRHRGRSLFRVRLSERARDSTRCGRTTSRTYSPPSPTRCDESGRRPSPWAVPGSRSVSIPGIAAGATRAHSISGFPGSTSYEVMLAFLHAQSVGRPLKQAVVGLDFFGFNIFFPARARAAAGPICARRRPRVRRLSRDRARHPAARRQRRDARRSGRAKRYRARRRLRRPPSARTQPDAASGVKAARYLPIGTRRDTCRSIRTRRAGSPRAPLRAATSTISPSGASRACSVASSRPTGTRPATSPPTPRPASKSRSALFAPAISTTPPSAGPAASLGGLPPADADEWLRLRWPLLDRALFQVNDMLPLVLSREALKASLGTVLRQSMPAPFDDSGVRLFGGQEEMLRRLGGVGHLIRSGLGSGAWGPWLKLPQAHVLLHQRGHRHDHVRSIPVHAAAGVCRRHRPAHVRHAGACGGPHPPAGARARRAIRVLAQGTGAHQRGGGRARRQAAAAAVGFQRCQHDHARTGSPVHRYDSDAMVLGAFALSQDHRRSRARPGVRNQRAGAAAAGGFRRSG